jgi:hypothetical protein
MVHKSEWGLPSPPDAHFYLVCAAPATLSLPAGTRAAGSIPVDSSWTTLSLPEMNQWSVSLRLDSRKGAQARPRSDFPGVLRKG